MLRRIAAGAGSLGLVAAATAAQAQTTGREIFTPVQNDLALVNLRKLLGCVVDGVWTAATCTDDRPLTVALGYFNGACLIIATILACYLLYSMVADTANDGQAFGRGSSAKYTLLRVITGAILSLPIKSGLSLVQILVVQLAVWGSGFGDTLWTRVAGTQLNGMYGTLTQPTQALGDFALRGKLAKVLEGRLYGHVCAQSLQQYANNVSGRDNAASIVSRTVVDRGSFGSWSPKTTTYYFADSNGYFRRSNNLCGSVVYEHQKINANIADTKDATTTSILIALAEQQSQRAFQAAINSLDGAASGIATTIMSGSRDDEDIQTRIKAAVDAAYDSVSQSLTQSNNAQLDRALRDYLTNATDNGWLSAAMWQRSMSLVQAKLLAASAGPSASITAVPPAAIHTYMPSLGHSAFWPLAQEAQRNVTYVGTFSGFVAAQGTGSVARIASDDPAAQADAPSQFARALSAIYSGVLNVISRPETGTWKDPILEVQEIGQSIANWGIVATGAGVSSDFVGWGLGFIKHPAVQLGQQLAETASGFFYFLGTILFAAAFMLVGLVPFVVIVHFLMGTFNWFLVVAEAMIAVPIWLLTKFMPARSDSFVGNSGQGYMFFLGILLRPPLIVIGLLVSLLLMRLGLDITHIFFRGALAMLSPDGTIAYAMVGTAGLFVYAVILFSIVMMSAGQISALPETVLSWIGGQIERRTGNTAAVGAAAIVMPRSPTQVPTQSSGRMVKDGRSNAQTMLSKMRGWE
ncbi:DotA/TraY family protein [Methylobacterium sp. J-043]|uniref:DotA/TraY family protein n=1 Tax=Methylorubrum TaxID=2282523 RepID=UPI0020A07B01|nr:MULTISPECIES: DotA/TraY family protein [Methylorubrum]MCJ2029503.1 DotA/TraY family protein [Methylobacterium sp. J-043]MCP1551464.1 conjugal transfer/type IV secretion protein DotA/TraY [Methylorubrum zatmanii]MCP1556401.1 conjugal transfer/type IV secretion protein DotA/TraY [Methylorubrum extorquens]MCP1581938.1 conjugal transfer/type IV secretion protein DotA/TraY [Methylorubrum extorquens]